MERKIQMNGKVSIILRALLFSYVLTGLMLLLLTFLLYKFGISASFVSIGIIIVYVLSAFIGGFISGKGIKNRKFIWGCVLGALYFLLLVIVSLIVNRGIEDIAGNFLTTMLICIGSGTLGGMLS